MYSKYLKSNRILMAIMIGCFRFADDYTNTILFNSSEIRDNVKESRFSKGYILKNQPMMVHIVSYIKQCIANI